MRDSESCSECSSLDTISEIKVVSPRSDVDAIDNATLTKVNNPISLMKPNGRGNKTSKYRGVCWSRQRKMWRARIKVNGKLEHLGYFSDEEEAARKYDQRSFSVNRSFGIFNFPDEIKKYTLQSSNNSSTAPVPLITGSPPNAQSYLNMGCVSNTGNTESVLLSLGNAINQIPKKRSFEDFVDDPSISISLNSLMYNPQEYYLQPKVKKMQLVNPFSTSSGLSILNPYSIIQLSTTPSHGCISSELVNTFQDNLSFTINQQIPSLTSTFSLMQGLSSAPQLVQRTPTFQLPSVFQNSSSITLVNSLPKYLNGFSNLVGPYGQ